MNTCPKSVVRASVDVVYKYRAMRYKTGMLLNPQRKKLFCPCCETRVKSFVQGTYLEYPERFNPSLYENPQQDVLCPVCRSLPRHRILAFWCEDHKERLKTSRILYFAPEYSMTLWMKRNGVSCTTADLYNKADLKLDILNTHILDASCDIVVANHVLEHVNDFRKALTEIYRILKPKGCFICSFPMDPKIELLDEEEEPLSAEERLRRFGQNDHKRIFGMKADQFLTEAGFDVEIIKGEDCPEEILPVVGPADYDMNILFCCRKG